VDQIFIFDRAKIGAELDRFVDHAQTLIAPKELSTAIQAWDTIASVAAAPPLLAQANLSLGRIYREWDELFTAQRFLAKAHEVEPADLTIRSELESLNRHIADNQTFVFDERARQNSDSIVSLFRIATGLKLLQMDKPVQAYPLMKSRTKIYPNAAVAKHLLTGIIITEDEKNSAIEFLEAGEWLTSTQHEVYAITDRGLYAFYTELAKLHIANEAYDEAAACYEQAYWLDDSSADLLYHKLICDAKSQEWQVGLALLDWLSDELPSGIEPVEYSSAAATICGLAYQATQDLAIGGRAVAMCETVLEIDRRNKEISNLLKSLRAEKSLQPHLPEAKSKRRWWHR
jgi:tetratricopeptide (TPR) repeat protein